ncbi:glycosyltransferase family 1 protein [Parasaccharibacter sp. TMW2.1882]|nr:glycosyltransferase family 1 protein [Parasaccharibacter sp. TMW2.1885]MCL1495925.1 glycosyltransferase family 1 protein [Parasaccharibacter sp. TMW2.1882]MUH02973.1 glycosyltransferase [Bombella sp. ESL0387]
MVGGLINHAMMTARSSAMAGFPAAGMGAAMVDRIWHGGEWQTAHPLKIVHVGDFFFSLKKKAPTQFSVGGKLSNGLIRNGHHVINFPYRDVARSGGWFGSRKMGRHHLFRALKEFVAFSAPDILLLGHGYMIPPFVIEELRQQQPGMTVVQWNVDALFVESNAKDFAARHQVVDASFISTAGPVVRQVVGERGHVGYLPNPVDRSVERGQAFALSYPEADVFYSCGNPARLRTICGRDWNMEEFCETLEERLPPSVRFAYAGVRRQPYVSGAAYSLLLEQTAMGLNISRRADYYLYSSDRLAQMIGNGQLVFMERQTGFDRIFSDQEMAFFSSLDELVELVSQYHKAPTLRKDAARAGWQRYHALFNECAVADYIIGQTLGTLPEEAHAWRHLTNL